MKTEYLYHYKKSRRKRSIVYFNMAFASLAYIGGLFAYEHYSETSVSASFRSVYIAGFAVSAVVLFFIALWHLKNPAEYEAKISAERFVVHYPGSDRWSFDVAVSDIERFEHRQSHSHAGSGIGDQGLVMKDGRFVSVGLNYGPSMKKMRNALRQANPDIAFPNRINKQFETWPFKKKNAD